MEGLGMRALRLLAVFAAVLLVGGAAAAQKRVALVIGNGGYEALNDLKNPPADAEDIGAVMETLGFSVRTEIDLDRMEMIEAFARFAAEAADADVAFFYYAGHGMQVASENYLLPVDAELQQRGRCLYRCRPAQRPHGQAGARDGREDRPARRLPQQPAPARIGRADGGSRAGRRRHCARLPHRLRHAAGQRRV
jgi:hypothetical protein